MCRPWPSQKSARPLSTSFGAGVVAGAAVVDGAVEVVDSEVAVVDDDAVDESSDPHAASNETRTAPTANQRRRVLTAAVPSTGTRHTSALDREREGPGDPRWRPRLGRGLRGLLLAQCWRPDWAGAGLDHPCRAGEPVGPRVRGQRR